MCQCFVRKLLPLIKNFSDNFILGRDRELYFPNYYFFADRRLIKHKIKTVLVKDLDDCEVLCYRHDNCVSLNIKKDPDSVTGQQECELNNSTHTEHDGDLTTNNSYLYRGAKVIIFLFFVFITINYSPRIFTKPEMNNILRVISRGGYQELLNTITSSIPSPVKTCKNAS